MSRTTFLSAFSYLPFFTKQALMTASERLSVSHNTLDSYIQIALQRGELLTLKKGMYVSKQFFVNNRAKLDYIYSIASKLVEPSYISRETALQYYGLLAEANQTVVTSATARITRTFRNTLGIFEYKTVKANIFSGYKIIKKEFTFLIAEPYKAIFDYLYFRIPKRELRMREKVLWYLDEFRIDCENLSFKEMEKLFYTTSRI